jgi:hypothetical protein
MLLETLFFTDILLQPTKNGVLAGWLFSKP